MGMDDRVTQMAATAWAIFSSVSLGHGCYSHVNPLLPQFPESVLAGWLAGFRFPPPIWPSDLGWLSHLVPMLLKQFPWSSLPSFPSSQNYVLGWPKPDLPAGFNSLVREFASVPLWNSFSGKLTSIPIPFWELEVSA